MKITKEAILLLGAGLLILVCVTVLPSCGVANEPARIESAIGPNGRTYFLFYQGSELRCGSCEQ